MTDGDSSLVSILAEEIRSSGPISVARYMELALYHPQYGYYSSAERAVGKAGDFYTSVSVGALFGELLGYQFLQWLEKLPTDQPLYLVETGAHNGDLSFDLLQFFQKQANPALFERIQSLLIEPLPSRRQKQAEKLSVFGEKVRWISDIGEIERSSITGIILSNELLDAMPVHQVRWNKSKGEWFEWGIGFMNGSLCWTQLRQFSTVDLLPHLPSLPPELQEFFPDGFCYEISLAAMTGWSAAAKRLKNGYLFTADYGFDDLGFLHPERANGTLRTYGKHKGGANILETPGQIDITASVNFSKIEQAGIDEGLTNVLYKTQAKFLNLIAMEMIQSKKPTFFTNPEKVRQFQTLTHPEHLGRSFKILVQSKF